MKKGDYVLMKKAYVLMTQWKDDEPQIAGVFSSFDKAVACFVRDEFKTTKPSEIAQIALKMAHKTDDVDFADFGSMRAWVEEHDVDERCENREKGGGDDGR